MNTPNYHEVKHALETAHNLVTPAELHGILCGLICAGLSRWDENTIPETLMLELPEDADTTTIHETLNTLFTHTKEKIQAFELDFQLLLPEEDEPLDARAQEFGKWCEGFILGMGLSDVPHTYHDQNEVDDILYKLSEAAKISFHDLSFSEEDETMFAEVTEFIRLSVFAIYQELSGVNTGFSSSSTLH